MKSFLRKDAAVIRQKQELILSSCSDRKSSSSKLFTFDLLQTVHLLQILNKI